MNAFQTPMQPWPGLAPYSHTIELRRSGLTIYYYDSSSGAGAPALLIHGLGDEADTWRHIFPALASQRRLIAPDLPGFGRSAKPRLAYSVPFYVKTILELLDSLDIQRITLIGHSLGAVIAQTIALAHPERLERLVLISGGLAARSQKLDLVAGFAGIE